MFVPRTRGKFRLKAPPESNDKTSSEPTQTSATATTFTNSQVVASRGARATNRKSSSSSHRIAFALVTLSWSSLNAPLRSILNGFYYLAAIVSLLLLIAYIHQAKAQHNDHKMTNHQQIEFLQPAAQFAGPARARSRRTSSPTPSVPPPPPPAGTKSAAATKRFPAPVNPDPSSRQTSKRLALPELSFRMANNNPEYSENNRGSRQSPVANGSQSLIPSSSQWTPIVHNVPPRVPVQPLPPSPPLPQPQLTAPVHLPLPPPPLSPPPVAAPSVGYETRHQPPHWTGGDMNTRHDRAQDGHPDFGSEHRRTWRKPRLNPDHAGAGYRQSKLYKRVLICDKTLVSLDYLRDFGAEPRPFPMAHYSFGDPSSVNYADDNSIEIDLSGPGDFFDRRASNTITSRINATGGGGTGGSNVSQKTTTTSTTSSPETPLLLDQTTDSTTTTTTTIERRSYQFNLLPDEDALVKCDMWDLEKGLKNRKPPPDILDLAVKADFDTVRDAINRCRQLTEKTLPPDDEYRDGLEIMSTEDFVSLFSMKRGLLPGTKWCGLGDQASTYNDLGPKHRIDICCRAHDHCPIRLKPFRNDYGVLNIALYTKSHCDCDADFYRCLREAHSRTADMLGNLYFNVMKLQCIREERLKVCREVRPIALGFERCVRYEENPKRRVFKFTTPPVAY